MNFAHPRLRGFIPQLDWLPPLVGVGAASLELFAGLPTISGWFEPFCVFVDFQPGPPPAYSALSLADRSTEPARLAPRRFLSSTPDYGSPSQLAELLQSGAGVWQRSFARLSRLFVSEPPRQGHCSRPAASTPNPVL
jgi:hypothetical protein